MTTIKKTKNPKIQKKKIKKNKNSNISKIKNPKIQITEKKSKNPKKKIKKSKDWNCAFLMVWNEIQSLDFWIFRFLFVFEFLIFFWIFGLWDVFEFLDFWMLGCCIVKTIR